MAKDKSKKNDSDKAEKKAKKGGDGSFAQPSEGTGGGDGWKISSDDNLGKLFLFTPKSIGQHPSYSDKTKSEDHIVADIVEINEKKPAESELHLDAWVFPRYLQGSLRGFVGERKVLGRLVKIKDPKYGTQAWQLEDVSEQDADAARSYLESVDPFKQ